MSSRVLLILSLTLLPLALGAAQCPGSTLEIELGTEVGPDGQEVFTWFREGQGPPVIEPNDVGCVLRSYAEDGYWIVYFFRAWVEDTGSEFANELRSDYGLTRLEGLSQADAGAILGGLVDAGDLVGLSDQIPLRILPSFMGFCGLYAGASPDNIKGIAQPIVPPTLPSSHSCQRALPWHGQMDIWTTFALPGRPWNDFWDGIALGYGEPDLPYLDYSGFVTSAVRHQGGDIFTFDEVFKDAVDLGLYLDIQAFAFRSGLPVQELTITPDPAVTSGILPTTTGDLPRFRISQPLTVRVPARAISRGNLRISQGGPGVAPPVPTISVSPGETVILKAGYVTSGSYALVPTLAGPTSVPLQFVSPLYSQFVVPFNAISGPFDLGNEWGVLDGSLTDVPWGAMSLDVYDPINPTGN